MKITYRTLAKLIEKMSDEQKDCDVTVEDSYLDECWPAELKICGEEHGYLDDNHPVIYFGFGCNEYDDRSDDVDQICKDIGLLTQK